MSTCIVRTPPILRYNGLTFLLSHAGRFDSHHLAEGPANRVLEDGFAGTGLGRSACDFRTIECKQPLLPGTKVVVCSGERAAGSIGIPMDRFKANRGVPLERDGIIYIPTFHLQDCSDIKDYEARALARQAVLEGESTEEYESDEDAEEKDELSVKEYGATRRRNYYQWTKLDIQKAARILRHGLHRNVCRYHLMTAIEQGTAILDSIPAGLPLFFDLETNPLTGKIICVGFSTSATEVYSVSVQPEMHGSVTDYKAICRFFRALVRVISNCSEMVIHNAQFDLFILGWLYRIAPPAIDRVYDTMVAHHRLYNGLEKSLGHCISLYTDEAFHKDEGMFTPNNLAQLKQLLAYNAKDVERMALVRARQADIARGIPGAEESIKQGNSSIVPLLGKAIRGMHLDTGLLCRTIDEQRKRAEILERCVLPKLAGGPLNPRSVPQVSKLLYETLGLPRPSGNESATGKKTLYKLALKFPAPLLKAIVGIRHISHEASQLSFQIWRQNRVTCSFLTDTDTYRLKSRALFAKWGTNVQNWPKKMRRVVVAPPGCKLIQVDQRNAEALIVAYLMRRDTKYRQLMLNNIKLHTYVTLYLFKEVWDREMEEDCERFMRCPIQDLRKEPRWNELEAKIRASDSNEPSTRYYYMGKQTGLSANYGVGATEFSKNTLDKSNGQVFIPYSTADRFLNVYRKELFPEVEQQFQDYVKHCATEDGVLRNLFGYPRVLPEHKSRRYDARYLKACYAWIPQSTVGTITNRADTALQRRIQNDELQCEVWTNTHDSLLVCCAEDRVQETVRAVQEAMNQTLQSPFGETFQMSSDASIGDNWYEQKEVRF